MVWLSIGKEVRNMADDQKKYDGHSNKQIARSILIDALDFALTRYHPRIETDLEKVAEEYSEAKMMVVKKYLGKMAHEIFLLYGHKKDLDFSAHPIVDKFDELGLAEEPRTSLSVVKTTTTKVA